MITREGLMKNTFGFTLIEALFVLAIFSVLAFMAAGAWSALQLRVEGRTAITLLANSLSVARNTAITRQIPVAVCGSRNANECDNQWQEGILVFFDVQGLGKPAAASDILGFYRLDTRHARLVWRGFGRASRLRFDQYGRSTASNGSFTYCPQNRESRYARQVVINRGGRVRYSRDRNGDGVHEDVSGKPLSCS